MYVTHGSKTKYVQDYGGQKNLTLVVSKEMCHKWFGTNMYVKHCGCTRGVDTDGLTVGLCQRWCCAGMGKMAVDKHGWQKCKWKMVWWLTKKQLWRKWTKMVDKYCRYRWIRKSVYETRKKRGEILRVCGEGMREAGGSVEKNEHLESKRSTPHKSMGKKEVFQKYRNKLAEKRIENKLLESLYRQ